MSMPSSSCDVATSPLSRPDFSSSSIWSRRSRDSDPWCAFTSSTAGDVGAGRRPARRPRPPRLSPSTASSLSRVASRSASRRALTKISVDRCCCDQLEQRGVDRRPDAAAHRPGRGRAADRLLDDLAERAHVVDRDDDLDSSGLRMPASTIVTGRQAAVVVAPAEEAGDLVERALGGRQPDALRRGSVAARRSSRSSVSGEVGAPLGGGQRVDLVDDHRLDAAQRLARLRGEHQVERLGRGDQEVGRVADQPAALVGRGVAGAHADGRLVRRRRPAARRRAGCRASGARRFFSTSTASARSGET